MTATPTRGTEEPGELGGEGRHRRFPLRRTLLRLGFLLLAALVAYVGITFAEVWLATRDDDPGRADAVVVLGAAQYNGRPSPVLEARLTHALALYRADVAPLIVVTGGRQRGDTFTEATTSYNWLRRRGVPDEAILKEVQGRNTFESMAAVARFLEPRGVDEVVLVSDSYHSKRLVGVAEEVGLDATVSPAGGGARSTPGRLRLLSRETAAVAVGRVVGYRRLTNWVR